MATCRLLEVAKSWSKFELLQYCVAKYNIDRFVVTPCENLF